MLKADLHVHTVSDLKKDNTEAIISAIKNPRIKIINHPYCYYFRTDIEKLKIFLGID
ncbi:hypothetical protein GF327_07700 [Candidatus Woesearchaeota archaeon]|nr:hypothetical protein [Candidatus Woesearchaeota archaeon]